MLCLHHETKVLRSKILIVSELLFGIYTLLWPRRTLRTVELEAQVGSPTINSARRPRRKSELKQYQQPEKLQFFKFVLGTRGMASRFRVRGTFRDEQGV